MLVFEGGFENMGLTEYLIIGGALLLIILLAVILFKPKKKKAVAERKVEQQEMKTEPVKVEPAKVVEAKSETEKEVVKAEEKPVMQDKPKAPTKTEVKETAKDEETEEEEVEEDGKPKRPAKYHISQNKDTDAEHAGEWRVRKEGSTKTIKYFRTQKEAIEFAEKLAENQDSSIVIHKRDGSIRKQDYKKK
ncbi:DUF2188 domain-containing protein [Acholeplasma hippikon]|uniref:DUF2188 domain-containing protein n=1 Tax=Acholeplasma hippikon TaxID=264636 RepID=A0A449BII9_9MOLU|nr:DUF2188 domain-containing protein [Acholeplasma hippikon]VEU82269.1 Uncharacterised protein [Acholeplasma hippikon]